MYHAEFDVSLKSRHAESVKNPYRKTSILQTPRILSNFFRPLLTGIVLLKQFTNLEPLPIFCDNGAVLSFDTVKIARMIK